MPLPADLRVRDLGLDDSPAVSALVSRGHATYRDFAPASWDPPEEDSARWDTRLGDPAGSSRGAFNVQDHLIAVLIWEQARASKGEAGQPAIAHVPALFVDPSRWRQGIATTLLTRAEDEMRKGGYHLARLWTPEEAPAQRLYERNGWRKDGRRAHDRLDLPMIGYEKELSTKGPQAPKVLT